MSGLAARLEAARGDMRKQQRMIIRARRLYKHLVWKSIAADPTGQTLEYCAARMLDSGLVSGTKSRDRDLRTRRFILIKVVFNHERNGLRMSWPEWILKRGWRAHLGPVKKAA